MAGDPTIYCSICGVPIKCKAGQFRNYEDAKTTSHLANARLIFPTAPLPEVDELEATPILVRPAKIGLDDEIPFAEILNEETNIFERSTAIGVFHKRRGATIIGYPLHECCWIILKKCLQSRKSVIYDEALQSLYIILNNVACEQYRLLWPHRYYGIEKYQTLETAYWSLPWNFPFVEDDPLLVNNEVWHYDSELHDKVSIPQFLPFPPELVDRVLSYLDWRDIVKLQHSQKTRTGQIPDSYWHQFLSLGAEFGYLCLGDEMRFHERFSWHEMFIIANREAGPSGKLRNRFRIWKICKELTDEILDITSSSRCKLVPVPRTEELHKLSQPLVRPDPLSSQCLHTAAESYKSWRATEREYYGTFALYRTDMDVLGVEALVVSYSGSGSLQYISSITCLPCGTSIGFVTTNTRKISTIRKTSLAVKSSEYGIIDLALFSDEEKGVWYKEEYFKHEEKVAIKRKTLRDIGDKLVSMQIIAKLDASKIVDLSIQMSDIESDEEQTQPQIFAEQHAWSPSIPSQSLDLNIGNYYEDNPCWEFHKFQPLEQVTFKDSPLKQITAWIIGVQNFVSGITFMFENPNLNPPLTLGRKRGAALDFAINGLAGEAVTHIDAYFSKSSHVLIRGRFCGIKVRTNAGRVGILAANPSKSDERNLMIPLTHKIQGFYGTCVQHQTGPFLTTLGIMTERSAAVIKLFRGMTTESVPETALEVPRDDVPFEHSLRNVIKSQFASKVAISDCLRIKCYTRNSDQLNLGFRVTGMTFEYRDSQSTFGNPRILGQIGGATPFDEALELDEDEVLKSIEVLHNTDGSNRYNYFVTALKVTTSKGKCIFWGIKKAYQQSEVLELHSDSILRWDFNYKYDLLRLEN